MAAVQSNRIQIADGNLDFVGVGNLLNDRRGDANSDAARTVVAPLVRVYFRAPRRSVLE